MKLHSNFHDYYDNAVGYGIDKNVHYNRFTKEVPIKIKTSFDFPSFMETFLLGFCGQIYPIIELERFDKEYVWEYCSDDYEVAERFYAYTYGEVIKKQSEWGDYSMSFPYSNDREKLQIKQFFFDWKYQSNEIFLEHKVPVWIVKLDRNGHKGIINPKLKDYGFDRIKDSFMTFQEISMYLSNILIEQKDSVVVEDKFRIEQHGFDSKTSFRKVKKRISIY